MRDGIGRMGDPFDFVLSHLQLPPEVTGIGGRACLAEEAATGAQVTVEGYSFHGDVHVYGTVDSITCPDSSSFLRYQYPSSLPSAVTQRMAEISERVIRQIGLDGITFNIEYFWDPDHDTISLLEVNPRHSQSHAELFEQVDGVANHDHMLQLALGREPRLRHREGPYYIAAKWFVRRVADGVASRVPTSQEIEQVERAIPGCTVDVTVATGDRLSELYDQDSYSYALATVYVGADDEDELIRKYEQALAGAAVRVRGADWMRVVDRQRFPHRIKEDTQLTIPLPDGTRLAGRVWRPETADMHPVPAVLEFVPYRQRDLTAVRDSIHHPYFAGHGYAAVRVDLRGSGDSEGVLTDEYLEQELCDAEQVLAWIAEQPWCDGRTGMMGISWGGFNTLQVAARRPPSLRAVVTACSTDDRYADDVHYMGGCLLTDNLSWASTMFAYNSCPPDPDVVGEQLAGDVAAAAARQRALAGGVAAPPAPRRLLAARLDL